MILPPFISKLRVVSISDQDDAGPWIRREFPQLFYVVQPSTQDGADYGDATWTGISGDIYYRNGEGADFSTVTNDWLESNIRSKGPLGGHYPKYMFIMEGDTPAFLNLIGNGLEGHRNPSWGGWGGRYVFRQPYGETHPIWTQGGDAFARTTSKDAVVGSDGATHVSNQATIWRWREAFQHDFAARMDWTIKPYAQANHAPEIVVNGQAGTGALRVAVKEGEQFTLSATGTRDPDGQRLHFKWFAYPEAGFSAVGRMADVEVTANDSSEASVFARASCRAEWLPRPASMTCDEGEAHIILAVTDEGRPALTSYRRIIVTVRPR